MRGNFHSGVSDSTSLYKHISEVARDLYSPGDPQDTTADTRGRSQRLPEEDDEERDWEESNADCTLQVSPWWRPGTSAQGGMGQI